MGSQFRILITGGGIGGFACAVDLARKGNEAMVLERSASLQI
jgi:2-polyprenyl-6-methoxyphenol hydroxylase-like FAD-dependent oxidoreductase